MMRFIATIFAWAILLSVTRANWIDARVVSIDGAAGSFVDLGGKTYIITCAHRSATTSIELGQRFEFTCFDGSHGVATVAAVIPINLSSDPLRDCALLTYTGGTPSRKAFKFSNRELRSGETVWVCGFPMDRPGFWSRRTTVVSDAGTLTIDGTSTPGESGGPIVNTDGELVGTLTASGSDGRTICVGRTVHYELCQRFCGPQGCGFCPGGNCNQAVITGPIYTPQPRPQPQPQTQQPQQPSATIPGPPGPAGPAGPPGKDAAACPCGPKWAGLESRLAKIEASITAISNRPAPTPTQPAAEQHVVVVADHNAPYWQRLAEAIANARKTYSGIQDTTLPDFNIGIHPQAVVYRNSVPVRVVKGQYEVENLLSRVSRGEAI